MKIGKYALGILFTLSLIFVLLITSFEAVLYWQPDYFEKEYEKYNVTADVQMEMEDLLDVTDKMMDYLHGNREDLQVTTIINGVSTEFFNQREIDHMIDVKNLFLAGLRLRRWAIGICLAALIALFFMKNWDGRILAKSICISTGGFVAVSGILAAIIASDFTKYFTMFHHIFFNNDLWLLNPRTDRLINIVPEPFFVDTAASIGICFGLCLVVCFGGSLLYLHKTKKPSS